MQCRVESYGSVITFVPFIRIRKKIAEFIGQSDPSNFVKQRLLSDGGDMERDYRRRKYKRKYFMIFTIVIKKPSIRNSYFFRLVFLSESLL